MIRVLLVAFMLVGVVTPVSAATLYLDPNTAALDRGDSIPVSVRIDTDESNGECINAVDAVITYSASLIPVDVSLGESILTVWVEPPTINEADRTVTFAGGIPNGYCGRIAGDPRLTNVLATIIFRSPSFQIGGDDSSTGKVSFGEQTAVYLNDGRGTRVTPRTISSTYELTQAGGTGNDPWLNAVSADTIPPEEFSITLERDERAYGGRYFIVFNTTDKQTGIDHYEVIEEPISMFDDFAWGGADAPWVVARSPYVLQDQSLNSTIRVRAIDKAGNEYVATLVPDESLRGERPSGGPVGSNNPWIFVVIAVTVVLLAVSVVGLVWWRRRTVTPAGNEFSAPRDPETNTFDSEHHDNQ